MNAERSLRIVRRLSEEEYAAERDAINAKHGENGVEATGLRDQALAVLFIDSGWTQDEIAKQEGKTQRWVSYRLTFARFLNFRTTGSKTIPSTLTERRFRDYWESTDGNETERFNAILPMIEEYARKKYPRRPGNLTDLIIKKFADGKWHLFKEFVKELDKYSNRQILTTLEYIRKKKTKDCFCERSQMIDTYSYRLVAGGTGKLIEIRLVIKELKPLLAELKKQGHREQGTASSSAVLGAAYDIEKLFEKYAE